MPQFLFTPVEHDPFGPALEYASELNGAPNAALPAAIGRGLKSDASRLVNSISGAFTDVGNALMGDTNVEIGADGSVSPMDPKLVDASNTLSGLVMEGGLASPRPAGSLGIFGGINARTANLDKLAQAMHYEKSGVPPDSIWRETGWGRGADGKWRFEISDQKSKFDESKLSPKQGSSEEWRQAFKDNGFDYSATRKALGYDVTVEDVMKHNDLFDAYPDLKKIPVRQTFSHSHLGSYDPQSNDMTLINPEFRDSNIGTNEPSSHSVMLHELQHAVQAREDFANGGAPQDPEVQEGGRRLKETVYNKMQEIRAKPVYSHEDISEFEYLKKIFDGLDRYDLGTTGYNTLSGEVEARNVQHRFASGIGTRIAPRQTEDTPRDFQWNRTKPEWNRVGK